MNSTGTLELPAKMLNVNEDIPAEFFIFVNQLNPQTEHNLKITKSFASAAATTASFSEDDFRRYLSGSLSFLPYHAARLEGVALSPYFMSAINDYRIEYDADFVRGQTNRLYPSRLSAVYAFGDYASCEEVSRKYRWPLKQVQKFKLKPWPFTRVVKVNMEVVSLLRRAYRVSSVQDPGSLWHHYWSGGGNLQLELPGAGFKRESYDSGVIWEYLIDGAVELI